MWKRPSGEEGEGGGKDNVGACEQREVAVTYGGVIPLHHVQKKKKKNFPISLVHNKIKIL